MRLEYHCTTVILRSVTSSINSQSSPVRACLENTIHQAHLYFCIVQIVSQRETHTFQFINNYFITSSLFLMHKYNNHRKVLNLGAQSSTFDSSPPLENLLVSYKSIVYQTDPLEAVQSL